ncbi:MAG: PepSY-associated TM helix domain-containing protein [Bacteroidia bacterium]|nr:PepSY-associated TM helix domain-containing protein [Bacteroidia bacterium]
MSQKISTKIRRLNIVTHRDVGYFFSFLIIIYCISGLALNHVDDWNPDFVIEKQQVKINHSYIPNKMTKEDIISLSKLVGETKYKVFDFPTPDQVKIYYDNASLHVNFTKQEAEYEKVNRRLFFYQTNILHRNSIKGWKWISDIFAVALILISITGLFVLKGKNGISGRGKWFILGGLVPPLIAWIIHHLI